MAIPRALARYGGVLLAPRRTVMALPEGEGARDGIWLGLLFVIAVGLRGLVEGAADLAVTRNFSGVLMLVSSLGRGLLVPIIALVLAQTILGRERAHRSGLCLVPVVLAAAVLRELPVASLLPWPYAAEIVLVILAGALAVWIRPAVPPSTTEPA
jgi:hypothetical protein